MTKPLVGHPDGQQVRLGDDEARRARRSPRFGVAHECRVLSAHRTPAATIEYVSAAEARGLEVIIAAAGGAAHLAGVVAAHTLLPVLGVPMESAALKGLDSLLATVQMPGGIPVRDARDRQARRHQRGAAGRGDPRQLATARCARSCAPSARSRRRRCSRKRCPEEGPPLKVLLIGGNRFLGHELALRLVAGLARRHPLQPRHARGRARRPRRAPAGRPHERGPRARAGRAAASTRSSTSRPSTATTARRAAALFDGQVGHYVVISTGQVYLVRQGCPRPAREADYDGPLLDEPQTAFDRGQWEYGIKKRALEDELQAAWEKRRFPATRLRIPMVNGSATTSDGSSATCGRKIDGGPILLPGGGARVTRHVYSGAVVKAILDLLGREASFGCAYNLAQDETPSLRELLGALASLVGAAPRLVDVSAEAVREAGLDPLALSPFSGEWMSFVDPALAQQGAGLAPRAARRVPRQDRDLVPRAPSGRAAAGVRDARRGAPARRRLTAGHGRARRWAAMIKSYRFLVAVTLGFLAASLASADPLTVYVGTYTDTRQPRHLPLHARPRDG